MELSARLTSNELAEVGRSLLSREVLNLSFTKQILHSLLAMTSKKILLPSFPRPEKCYCTSNRNGSFSVESSRPIGRSKASSSNQAAKSMWTELLRTHMHERYKMMLWRIGIDLIPTS